MIDKNSANQLDGIKPWKSLDTGLSLLRIILSLFVVMTHFYGMRIIFSSAVPVFCMLSFYLTGTKSWDKNFILKRVKRFYIPLFLWAIVAYFILKILSYFPFVHFVHPTLKALFLQFLFGSSKELYVQQFWYNIELIVISVFFFFFFQIKQKARFFCMYVWWVWGCIGITVFILSFCLQYSGMNFRCFSLLPWELSWLSGRFCEVLPYCLLGVFFAKMKFKEKAFFIKISCAIVSFILFILIFGLHKYKNIEVPGFAYSGFPLMFLSISIFSFFMSLPKIKNSHVANIINVLGFYSTGVYYSHLLVGRILIIITRILFWDFSDSLFFSLLVFFLSLGMSLFVGVISEIDKKKILRYFVQ